jgi:hypothetical protein
MQYAFFSSKGVKKLVFIGGLKQADFSAAALYYLPPPHCSNSYFVPLLPFRE